MKKPKYADINPLTKLHPGEPFFFIRAQDKLSVDIVMEYSRLLEKEGLKLSADNEVRSHDLMMQACQVASFAHRFLDWQEENPDKVKLPD
jgi:hypothetical protein